MFVLRNAGTDDAWGPGEPTKAYLMHPVPELTLLFIIHSEDGGSREVKGGRRKVFVFLLPRVLVPDLPHPHLFGRAPASLSCFT